MQFFYIRFSRHQHKTKKASLRNPVEIPSNCLISLNKDQEKQEIYTKIGWSYRTGANMNIYLERSKQPNNCFNTSMLLKAASKHLPIYK